MKYFGLEKHKKKYIKKYTLFTPNLIKFLALISVIFYSNNLRTSCNYGIVCLQVDDLKAKLAAQEIELKQKNEDADKLIEVQI